MIFVGGIEIDLDIVLVSIDQTRLSVAGIVLGASADCGWIKRRIEQRLCHRINRFNTCNIVIRDGSVPIQWIIELVS